MAVEYLGRIFLADSVLRIDLHYILDNGPMYRQCQLEDFSQLEFSADKDKALLLNVPSPFSGLFS